MVGIKSDDLNPKLDPEDSHGGRKEPTLNKLSSNHHGNMEVTCYPCVHTPTHTLILKINECNKNYKKRFQFFRESLSILKNTLPYIYAEHTYFHICKIDFLCLTTVETGVFVHLSMKDLF